MVRQYIGARYVTKIYENSVDPSTAEWEAGVTYEPLTLVTYLNSSYLSKKDVPGAIGNPASNPSYWVVTGAYNGQIMQLQNDISDINNANYIQVSKFAGSDDTQKLQNAVDNNEFVILDSNLTVETINIERPVHINLNGYKITSSTHENNTFNVRCDNVEIFNGEIETTEDNINNVNGYGSCVFVNDRYLTPPIAKNINLHDLKLSTNSVAAVVYYGEIYNSTIENVELDGSRSAYNYPEGINIEWTGTAHVSTYHPHNIIVKNIYGHDFTNGYPLRTSAAFDILFENIISANCGNGIRIDCGDYAGEAAQARYQRAINKNIIIKNFTSYNCHVGIGSVGIDGYIGSHPQITIEGVTISGNATSEGIDLAKNDNTIIKQAKIQSHNIGLMITGCDHCTVDNCDINDSQTVGIYFAGGSNNIIRGNKVSDSNQSETTGVMASAVLVASAVNSLVSDNVVGNGSSEHMLQSIRNSGDHSIITNNIVYSIAIADASTGTIIDNNNTI